MASSSNPAEVTPPWLELPPEITTMILQKLGIVEVLTTAEKVCPSWRRVCQDAAIWQRIDIQGNDPEMLKHDLEKLCRDAVDRSQGQLIDINFHRFGSDDMLRYISQSCSKLRRLRLVSCFRITAEGLSQALKNFPLLEELHLYFTGVGIATIKSVGYHCPHLKSLKMYERCRGLLRSILQKQDDGEALAIAENMPQLSHLLPYGNHVTNEGIQAILEGCPHLETLYLGNCFSVDLGAALGRLCRQRIKDFNCC